MTHSIQNESSSSPPAQGDMGKGGHYIWTAVKRSSSRELFPQARPPGEIMYRCSRCRIMSIPDDAVIKVEGLEDVLCPQCKNPVEKQCDKDHRCTCTETIQGGIHLCPDCGATICACGSHDCLGISRITGYMMPTFGWNAGKAQELKDRQHYTVT